MDPITVAGLVAASAAEILKLVGEAVETSRAGNESAALAKLDQALSQFEASIPGTRHELDAVKARIEQQIRDKFPPPTEGTPV
jgi:hypothetical protein